MNGYKTNQIEYVDIDRWRKAIRNSRLHDEADVQKLRGRIESMSNELELIERRLEHYGAEEELMSQTIRAYEERIEQPSKRSSLQGNSLRETLIIHFANPSGMIIGIEASKSLVDIGYFPDRSSADSAIYTALAKLPFKKLDKGVYAIPTDSPEWKRLRLTNEKTLGLHRTVRPKQKEYRKTELMDRVQSILAEHPNWNVDQVRKELQKQRWDFKGKHPSFVVSGVFMRIKQDQKQATYQTLPLRLHAVS